MISIVSYIRNMLLFAISLLFIACIPQEKPTHLGDIDITSKKSMHVRQSRITHKPRSHDEIRQAYAEYISNADIEDSSRINALDRLAEIEFEYSNKLLQAKENNTTRNDVEEERYNNQLNRTIAVLSTRIRDYPNASNNDALLYQLAKIYDQKGELHNSIITLNKLVKNYPKSLHYAESLFRIAENAFSRKDYRTSENVYTRAIAAPNNQVFYEKAIFKRGWSRFKQQKYTGAVNDFMQAVLNHNFGDYEQLDETELDQFNEYFRAIGLSFSYMGGSESLYKYFKNKPDFKYTYYTYETVSDIYLKQERYSDAVETHKQFIKHFPKSNNIPYSDLKIIKIWKDSGFFNKVYGAIDGFYAKYNPSSRYWINQNENSRVNRSIRRSLKEYVVLVTGYHHNQYQKNTTQSNYNSTKKWYQRYLNHYSTYAHKDNIYFLYGELLSQNKFYESAFRYYELAAFDNDIIVNKEAAYASIITSNTLLAGHKNNKKYRIKNIAYSLKYGQKYPKDKRTYKLIKNAVEIAFNAGNYKSAIELADLVKNNNTFTDNIYISSLKAESYFKLNVFKESESIYSKILSHNKLPNKQKPLYRDKLALSIYKQGEHEQRNNNIPNAIDHFARISTKAPNTAIAITGLYDAIALNMQHDQWDETIKHILSLQKLYPDNKYKKDISKKLSVAYLKSNQNIKAAREFERLATLESDVAVKSAALWQAAELYVEKNKIDDAIRSFEEYAHKFKKPHTQYMEAMNKLTELYTMKGLLVKTNKWRNNIVNADNKALNNVKTDRTNHITSYAYLGLAKAEKIRFDRVKLSLPLKKSLLIKKEAMINSVKLYGNASKNNIYEISTEATYSIALIYKNFSKALLESDRPTKLNTEELDQYEILLEDQAFPFEDKAIEFFEINLARIKEGLFNHWITSSHNELKKLFPVRYNKTPKLEDYVDIFH